VWFQHIKLPRLLVLMTYCGCVHSKASEFCPEEVKVYRNVIHRGVFSSNQPHRTGVSTLSK
jgi:hypothetical protein